MSYLSDIRQLVGSRPLLVPGGRAVVTDANDRVLFHRRSDLGIWDLPGGGAELGESMPDAVVREVHEETGLTVEQHVPIGLASDPIGERVRYPNGDIVQAVSLILWVTEWSGGLRLSDESTELRFHDPADIGELRPNIAATISAFADFKATGEFQLF